jgi:hypothetical protein
MVTATTPSTREEVIDVGQQVHGQVLSVMS